ncbi:MAG: carboxypeptidase-like regulatory domain-containing protein, partial [Candidatus Thorarchaeota archaeon]
VVGIGEEVDPPVVTGSVSGRVVGEDGDPLEGAWVRLKEVGSGDVVDTEITGQDCMFKFTDVEFGEYIVVVSGEGYVGIEMDAFSLTEGASDVDVGGVELKKVTEAEIGSSGDWMWVIEGALIGVIVVVVVGILLGKRKGNGGEESE